MPGILKTDLTELYLEPLHTDPSNELCILIPLGATRASYFYILASFGSIPLQTLKRKPHIQGQALSLLRRIARMPIRSKRETG